MHLVSFGTRINYKMEGQKLDYNYVNHVLFIYRCGIVNRNNGIHKWILTVLRHMRGQLLCKLTAMSSIYHWLHLFDVDPEIDICVYRLLLFIYIPKPLKKCRKIKKVVKRLISPRLNFAAWTSQLWWTPRKYEKHNCSDGDNIKTDHKTNNHLNTQILIL